LSEESIAIDVPPVSAESSAWISQEPCWAGTEAGSNIAIMAIIANEHGQQDKIFMASHLLNEMLRLNNIVNKYQYCSDGEDLPKTLLIGQRWIFLLEAMGIVSGAHWSILSMNQPQKIKSRMADPERKYEKNSGYRQSHKNEFGTRTSFRQTDLGGHQSPPKVLGNKKPCCLSRAACVSPIPRNKTNFRSRASLTTSPMCDHGV